MKKLAIILLLLSGCTNQVIQDEQIVLTKSLKEVQKEFQEIPKEDQDLIYKQFAGGAAFIKNAENLDNSAQFEVLLGKVQNAYGWDREKYPDFTDAVSEYLKEQDFEQPRSLKSKSDKQWLYEIFHSLSEAVK